MKRKKTVFNEMISIVFVEQNVRANEIVSEQNVRANEIASEIKMSVGSTKWSMDERNCS